VGFPCCIHQAEYQSDDFNVGINHSPVTVLSLPHLRVHLILNYTEEDIDFRGGVRES
jgi:diadenosine tetraphosphate (Ap4A) HIT family hydrolase